MNLAAEIASDRRLKSLARKFARRTESEGPLPPEISVPATSEEWVVIAELGHILKLASRQEGKKAVFAIPCDRRTPAAWASLREFFAPAVRTDCGSDEIFRRARNIAPKDIVDALTADKIIVRFVGRGNNAAREFLRLLEWTVNRVGKDEPGETTLSQVGSDIFGDSKLLRSRMRRTVFERIASAAAGLCATDGARNAFARLGIEENPFTSSVTVFAPFSFTLETGNDFDYPERMFRAGLAVQLPRQTVMRIRNVRLADRFNCIVTSENAAPFEQIVRAGVPCLYTEGYPNAAVLRLLGLFATQGAFAEHAGDGDLDGFLIADRIAAAIPVRRIAAAEVFDSDLVSRRPVSASMRKRWEAYLSAHEDFAHTHALRFAMEHGWPEQESYANICPRRAQGSWEHL